LVAESSALPHDVRFRDIGNRVFAGSIATFAFVNGVSVSSLAATALPASVLAEQREVIEREWCKCSWNLHLHQERNKNKKGVASKFHVSYWKGAAGPVYCPLAMLIC